MSNIEFVVERPSALKDMDFEKVKVIDASTIIRGVFLRDFYGNDLIEDETNGWRFDMAQYFENLLAKENIPQLRREILKFIRETPVKREGREKRAGNYIEGLRYFHRAARYKSYLRKTLFEGILSNKYRESIVAFLAAIEYRKMEHPGFRFLLSRNEGYMALGCVNYFSLMVEDKKGKHAGDKNYKYKVLWTLPSLVANPEKIPLWHGLLPMECAYHFNDIYTCGHELGHLTFVLLGLNPPDIDLKDFWGVKRILPTHIKEFLILKDANKEIFRHFKTRGRNFQKWWNFKNFATGELKKWKGTMQHFLEHRNDKNWKFSINLMKKIFFPALEQAGKNDALEIWICSLWSNFDELIQIGGICSFGGETVVNWISDLDILKDYSCALRWLHQASILTEDIGEEEKMEGKGEDIRCIVKVENGI